MWFIFLWDGVSLFTCLLCYLNDFVFFLDLRFWIFVFVDLERLGCDEEES